MGRRSFETDFLKTSLYFAMCLQIVQQGLIAYRRLGNSFFERCQIFLVFSQSLTDSIIDNIRDATVCVDRLQTKCGM